MTPKVTSKPTRPIADQQRVAERQTPITYQQLNGELQSAVAPGRGRSQWLSEAEIGALIDKAMEAGPDVVDQLKAALTASMKTGKIGDQPLQVGEAALQKLSEFTEVPAGTYRAVMQAKDGEASHELAEGLKKEKAEISGEEITATRKKLAFGATKGGQAVTMKDLTPHMRAARAVGAEVKTAVDAELAENHPVAAAAMGAVEPHMVRMFDDTVMQLAKDPESLNRVAGAIAKVGQTGFQNAVKDAGPGLAQAFTQATGVPAMNHEVVSGLLTSIPSLAEKISPDKAGSIAKTCADIGQKLGVETAGKKVVEEGAKQVSKKAAKKAAEAGGKKVAEKAAQAGAEAVVKAGAEKVAKEGAEVAVKGAATAGKATPGLGNAISLGCALVSGIRFFKALFSKETTKEQVAKEGLNTLMQTAGVAFPWVALAGDVVDVGWTAKMAATEEKTGKKNPEIMSKQEAAPLVSDPARLLASVLEGAGKGDAASALNQLARDTESAGNKTTLERSQLGALSAMSNVASTEASKAAGETDDAGTKDALNTVAHGFGELFSVLYAHRRMKGADGPKRDQLKADLLRISGDVALGAAALSTERTLQDVKGQ